MVHFKKNGKLTWFWKCVIGVGSVLGVLGAAWGTQDQLHKKFLPREVYDLRCEMQQQTMQKMQNSIEFNDALNWLRYTQKEERDAYKQWKRNPNDAELRQDFEDAKQDRKDAEEHLNKIKAKMGYR